MSFLMRRTFRDFDPLFDPRSWPFAGVRKTFGEFPWTPALEMTERDHKLMVKVDLPGLKKEEVTVNVTTEGLAIEGERTLEAEDKKSDWFTTERTYGHFYRLVPLPEGVNFKEVTGTFKNGVLEVTVPFPAAAATTPHTDAGCRRDGTQGRQGRRVGTRERGASPRARHPFSVRVA
jgi:HSP20 family protein